MQKGYLNILFIFEVYNLKIKLHVALLQPNWGIFPQLIKMALFLSSFPCFSRYFREKQKNLYEKLKNFLHPFPTSLVF